MNSISLSTIRDRVLLAREAKHTLRQELMGINTLDGTQRHLIKSEDDQLRLTWESSAFTLIDDTSIYKRGIECAIFKGEEKVMAADFIEFKTKESYRNKDFFWHMDDEAQYLGEIAIAYLSGWDADDLDSGNVAFLNNIAATGTVSANQWIPLFQKFVDARILKSSFVMIAKPFPYDVVHVINQGDDLDEMQALARTRHLAGIKFAEKFGMRKYGDEARTPDWTYQMSKKEEFVDQLLNPEFRDFTTRDLDKPMRHDF